MNDEKWLEEHVSYHVTYGDYRNPNPDAKEAIKRFGRLAKQKPETALTLLGKSAANDWAVKFQKECSCAIAENMPVTEWELLTREWPGDEHWHDSLEVMAGRSDLLPDNYKPVVLSVLKAVLDGKTSEGQREFAGKIIKCRGQDLPGNAWNEILGPIIYRMIEGSATEDQQEIAPIALYNSCWAPEETTRAIFSRLLQSLAGGKASDALRQLWKEEAWRFENEDFEGISDLLWDFMLGLISSRNSDIVGLTYSILSYSDQSPDGGSQKGLEKLMEDEKAFQWLDKAAAGKRPEWKLWSRAFDAAEEAGVSPTLLWHAL